MKFILFKEHAINNHWPLIFLILLFTHTLFISAASASENAANNLAYAQFEQPQQIIESCFLYHGPLDPNLIIFFAQVNRHIYDIPNEEVLQRAELLYKIWHLKKSILQYQLGENLITEIGFSESQDKLKLKKITKLFNIKMSQFFKDHLTVKYDDLINIYAIELDLLEQKKNIFSTPAPVLTLTENKIFKHSLEFMWMEASERLLGEKNIDAIHSSHKKVIRDQNEIYRHYELYPQQRPLNFHLHHFSNGWNVNEIALEMQKTWRENKLEKNSLDKKIDIYLELTNKTVFASSIHLSIKNEVNDFFEGLSQVLNGADDRQVLRLIRDNFYYGRRP